MRVIWLIIERTLNVSSDVTVVSPHMGSQGWPFADVDSYPGAQSDPLFKSQHVKDLYLRASPDYDGRYISRSPEYTDSSHERHFTVSQSLYSGIRRRTPS